MASAVPGWRDQRSQGANILERFERRCRTPQVNALLERQLRDRPPAHIKLGARGSSWERARRRHPRPAAGGINIKGAEFHGEWNYTISPNTYPPNCALIC